MARTKATATARKSTGGKAPAKAVATKSTGGKPRPPNMAAMTTAAMSNRKKEKGKTSKYSKPKTSAAAAATAGRSSPPAAAATRPAAAAQPRQKRRSGGAGDDEGPAEKRRRRSSEGVVGSAVAVAGVKRRAALVVGASAGPAAPAAVTPKDRQLLETKLRRFRGVDALKHVAKKILQVNDEQLSSLASLACASSAAQRFHAVVNWIVEKVCDVVGGRAEPDFAHLPKKLHNYLHFVEIRLLLHAEMSRKTWHAYRLDNYDRQENSLHATEKLRRRLKRRMPQSLTTSIQQEIQDDLVVFRVASVNKTKNEQRDQRRLLASSPIFVAYYPGEATIYTDKRELPPEHCDALAACFLSSGCTRLDLSGRHLKSLRKIRREKEPTAAAAGVVAAATGEDGVIGGEPAQTILPASDMFSVFVSDGDGGEAVAAADRGRARLPSAVSAAASSAASNRTHARSENDLEDDAVVGGGDDACGGGGGGSDLPLLNKIEIHGTSKFEGNGPLRDFRGNPSSVVLDRLSSKITLSGPNVLEGLTDMSNAGLLTDPPPAWIANITTAQTNVVRLAEIED